MPQAARCIIDGNGRRSLPPSSNLQARNSRCSFLPLDRRCHVSICRRHEKGGKETHSERGSLALRSTVSCGGRNVTEMATLVKEDMGEGGKGVISMSAHTIRTFVTESDTHARAYFFAYRRRAYAARTYLLCHGDKVATE